MKTTTLGLCALLFFSCTQEDFPGQAEGGTPCDYICFGLSPDGVAQTKGGARADADGYTSGRFVLRSADSADTLCVRTVVTDGIAGADKAVTRGAPVSDLATYEKFHVVCDHSDMTDGFFMDVDVTKKTDGLWGTEQAYYWPGAGPTLTFYAWAPTDDPNFTPTPTKGNLTFDYTVPAAAADQKDLLVAKTEALEGDYNDKVDLTFNHICTAVKFVVGSDMQAGTIKSVALKGVYNTGTYSITEEKWTQVSDIDDFSQDLDNYETDGSEVEGTPITEGEGTFMMLPQTLPTDATVEVEFIDGVTGSERTLSATIGGSDWPQGKTVTYKLSVTPEYDFDLSTPEEDRVLDAHYEIFLTDLVVKDLPDGTKWSISGPSDLDGVINDVTIQAQSAMNSYAKQGFWTDNNLNSSGNITGSARGETHYEGTGNGTFPIAIFVPENAGESERTINLNITLDDGEEVVATLSLKQLAPSWYGSDIGCERIEGAEKPWGFYWTKDFKLIYDLTAGDKDAREDLYQYIAWTKTLHVLVNIPFFGDIIKWIFGLNPPDLGFVEMDTHTEGSIFNSHTYADKVTLNIGELDASGIALSETDGVTNTKEMYNFQGFQLVNEIINRIENIAGFTVTTEGEGTNPSNNAAVACMKLNGWDIIYQRDGSLLKLVGGDEANPSWYLPAINEVQGIKDDSYPLSGEYWSSTAEDNNQNAYKYAADGTTSVQQRDTELHVRAVRQKTN